MSSLKIPVLMYHEVAVESAIDAVAKEIGSSWITLRKDFKNQINYLSKNGYTSITSDQLVNYISGQSESNGMPLKPVLITFDDGFSGNYEHAFPILQEHDMSATFFITINNIGQNLMLTWDQIREMSNNSMSIQSHTLTHPLFSCLDFKNTEKEIVDSKQIIQDNIGKAVNYISLPNGDFNKHYFEIVSDNGFRGGFSSIYGFNGKGTDPFLLRRIDIRKNIELSQYHALLDNKSFFSRWTLCRSFLKRYMAKLVSKKVYHGIYKAYHQKKRNRKDVVPPR